MKKTPIFLFCTAFLISSAGCQSKPAAAEPVAQSTGLKTYMQTAKLPDSFSFAFDPATPLRISRLTYRCGRIHVFP